jgi:HEPN domain-containing protein
MNGHMDSAEYVKKWLLKADNDLRVAENEMRLSPEETVTDAVCFHSQQAVEKFLKAYLITKNVEFEKTHNLEFLLELCIKRDEEFKEIDVGNLSFYSVEVRYPDEFYIPSLDEAKECIEIARGVKEFVLMKLGIEVEGLKKDIEE